MWIFVSVGVFLIVVTYILFTILGSKDLKKTKDEIEAPLLEIIMRNYLINDSEVVKLKRSYSILFKQSYDIFQNSILNLRILQQNSKVTYDSNPLQQILSPVFPVIALMSTIALNTFKDVPELIMNLFMAIVYFGLFVTFIVYILHIVQSRYYFYKRRITKVIDTHIIIAEEVAATLKNESSS